MILKKFLHCSKMIGTYSALGILIVLLSAFVPSFAGAVPETDPEAAPGSVEGRTSDQPSPVFIHLATGSFDPLQVLPKLPERLSYTPAEAATAGVYIVQFTGPAVPEWKQAVITTGGRLGDYLPDHAFLAHLDEAAKDWVQALPFVRWVGPYQPAYKLAPNVDYEGARSYRVVLAPWADAAVTQVALNSLALQTRSYRRGFSVVLDMAQLEQVARLPDVVWIEPYHMQRTYNDVAGGDIMSGTIAWSNGYTGANVTVAIADTGLDKGDPVDIHQDFSGRVAQISSWPVVYADYGGGCEVANPGADDGPADVDSGHGTHVAGSLAGNGARSSGQFKGLAYGATVTFQAVEQYTVWSNTPTQCAYGEGYHVTGIPDDLQDLLGEAYSWGARVHNNSWGGGDPGVYDELSAQVDDFIHQHPDMVAVFSAGNYGVDADGDGYADENSISSPATAKNVLSIGASESERDTGGYQYTWGQAWPGDFPANPTRNDHLSNNREHLAAFSSRGPMADGRIKPDVVAPGTNIISARSSQAANVLAWWGAPYNEYYLYMGGSSMSSPLVAGAAALVRDYYIGHEGLANPSAALIKATLINSAVDIKGYGILDKEAGQPIPNNHEGWGRVNVAAATTPGKRQFVDNTVGVKTGVTKVYGHYVDPSQPFKVTLVWSDYPGSPEAGKALVNDLDLRVIAPGGATSYRGNNFGAGWSRAGGRADTVNNVENVYIQSPKTGLWEIEIIGRDVPQGPQPFALVVDGNLSSADVLRVISINPKQAPNNGSLTGAVVRGTGFETTSVVHLVRGDEVITGTDLSVDTVSDLITATFDLIGATPGLWGVRVTNSSTNTATLEDALLVVDATSPDLSVSKTASQSEMESGNQLTYTIVIRNSGFSTATQVSFSDVYTLPGGAVLFERLSLSCRGGTTIVLPGGNGFKCWLPEPMAPGAEITYTLVVSVRASVAGTLVNSVLVESEEADSFPGDNTDQVSVLVKMVKRKIYLPLVLKSAGAVIPQTPIRNGDFENGSDGSWVQQSNVGADLIVNMLVFAEPHSGEWAAWLGGWRNESATLSQVVTVPSTGSTLSFWYWTVSFKDSCGRDYGYLKIGDKLIETFDLCKANDTGQWEKYTADLSSYAGQSLNLQFHVVTDDSFMNLSHFFLDDVAFE